MALMRMEISGMTAMASDKTAGRLLNGREITILR